MSEDPAELPSPGAARIAALDLIRGVAVLGILAVNMPGFAGPMWATLSPHMPDPGSFADELIFAATLVLFEGKMRALFTILFGAGIVLFADRIEAAGRNGGLLQLRRLGWLALFGYLHFALFWWGDILFSYALIGMAALAMRELPVRSLLAAALVLFAAWHLADTALSLSDVAAEERVRTGIGSAADRADNADLAKRIADATRDEMAEYRLPFTEQVVAKLTQRPFWPVTQMASTLGETLPLMLLGMALYRTGFFQGGWSFHRMTALGVGGTLIGLAMTAVVVAWLWHRHFPPYATTSAMLGWLAMPHVLTATGYAALLVRSAPALLTTVPGRWLTAAGRMAFSNYIGTTAAMTAIFYGWGLDELGRWSRPEQMLLMLATWTAMLLWSALWLARFRQGPLEWLWRSLIEGRPVTFFRE